MRYFRLTFSIGIVLFLIISSVQAQYDWPYRDALNRDIEFWKSIFTVYNSRQAVFHDSDHLDVIYRVLTFDSSASQKSRDEQVSQIHDSIRDGLLALSHKIDRKEELTEPERQLVKLWPDTLTADDYKEAAERIRVQQGLRDQFYIGLQRSMNYVPFIKHIFSQKELPEELAYLPHIESSYNPLARSKVGAAGMWQFMRSTARHMMKINRLIDERYDPIMSTRAATVLLKRNYEQTGDWGLAITAYNYGLAGIKRAAAEVGGNYLKVRNNYDHRRFRFASRNFYPEFLAVVDIMNHLDRYFPVIKPLPAPAIIRYRFKRSANLVRFARQCGIHLDSLRNLNPVYSRRVWKGWNSVPASYWISIPADADISAVQKYLQSPFANLKLPEVAEAAKPEKKFIFTGFAIADTMTATPPMVRHEPGADLATRTQQLALTTLPMPAASHTQSPNAQIPLRTPPKEKQDVSAFESVTLSSPHNNSTADSVSFRRLREDLQNKLAVQNDRIKVFINETLGHYAEWLELPTQVLRAGNGLSFGAKIYEGQTLKLDFSQISPKEFVQRRLTYHLQQLHHLMKGRQLVKVREYEINKGESVWNLAQFHFRIPANIVLYFNSERDLNRLRPGSIIRIPVFQNNSLMEENL